ncbi:MAG: ATP-dependent 6-phosphofructokinase [Anaerolineae bacterium]|nr:ATP-dependent 6-phosphofructokinase [Anaerolineae bacterium]
MKKPFDLIVVGELNVDLILTGDVTPAFGQAEKLVDDATLTLGSSSAIFACGAARLGLRVAFIGKVGHDEFGRFMLAALAERGIDTRAVVVDSTVKTGLSVILSRGNDRAILTHSGSIAALRFAEIDRLLLGQARHLHLGSYFLLDALRPDIPRLFDAAHAAGLTVSLDTNYDPTEKWNGGLADTLARTDIFLPNDTELQAIARLADTPTALARLAGQVPLVAVKLGPNGAIARRGAETVTAAPLPVTVVDTTGAGDSFDAGFIYGVLSGWELPKSLRLGCVCGALSTRAAGGTVAQPTLAEALAVL